MAEAGGYFQSAQVEGGSLRDQNAARYGNYVIRLPEENFSAFLDLLVWLSYHLFLVIVVLGAAGGGLFYWRRVRRGRKNGPPEEKQP